MDTNSNITEPENKTLNGVVVNEQTLNEKNSAGSDPQSPIKTATIPLSDSE